MKKDRSPAQVFSCEVFEIFLNMFFEEHTWATIFNKCASLKVFGCYHWIWLSLLSSLKPLVEKTEILINDIKFVNCLTRVLILRIMSCCLRHPKTTLWAILHLLYLRKEDLFFTTLSGDFLDFREWNLFLRYVLDKPPIKWLVYLHCTPKFTR